MLAQRTPLASCKHDFLRLFRREIVQHNYLPSIKYGHLCSFGFLLNRTGIVHLRDVLLCGTKTSLLREQIHELNIPSLGGAAFANREQIHGGRRVARHPGRTGGVGGGGDAEVEVAEGALLLLQVLAQQAAGVGEGGLLERPRRGAPAADEGAGLRMLRRDRHAPVWPATRESVAC